MPARPILLGHRGVRVNKSIPENTIAAFDRALEQGCDGFEFDLRATGDGRVVVCHDARADGITISRASALQLHELPEFREVLSRFARRAFLDIEIKMAGIEEAVLAALRDQPPARGYVVSSFLPEVVQKVKALGEHVPVGIICEKASQLKKWRGLPVDYVIAHKALATRELIQQVHDAGRKIFVWTVNDKASTLKFAAWGVDGIIGDDPRRLAQAFS